MSEEMLSRRSVRHSIMRARNARVAELGPLAGADVMPVMLTMHPLTLAELLMDSDAAEHHVIDFEGKAFMGIPIMEDDRMSIGSVAVRWPVEHSAPPTTTSGDSRV
jgi:hypothetical protein